MKSQKQKTAYWNANLRLVGALLAVWFFVSYGCGILFVDWLNAIHLWNACLSDFGSHSRDRSTVSLA